MYKSAGPSFVLPVIILSVNYLIVSGDNYPAPAAADAAPPKNQGNREARSAIHRSVYAPAAVPIFDHVFFALPRGVPV